MILFLSHFCIADLVLQELRGEPIRSKTILFIDVHIFLDIIQLFERIKSSYT